MKKVQFDESSISQRDKSSVRSNRRKFRIWVGNGGWFVFNNKKDAKKFIADLNRDVNCVIEELNYLCAEVYTYYRANYLHMTDDLSKSFQTVDHYFKMVFHHGCKMPNSVGNVIIHILKLVDTLQEIIEYLELMCKKYNLHHSRKQNLSVKLRLNSLVDFLLDYKSESGFKKVVNAKMLS